MTVLEKYLILALGLLLGVSLLGNYWLAKEYASQRDKTEEAVGDYHQADKAASLCSASVDSLTKAAKTQADAAAKDIQAARDAATVAQKRAQSILTAKPKFVGDDCKSAAAQVDDWLASRVPAKAAP